MENTKEKIIIALCLAIFIILCVFIYHYTFIESKKYYTIVDNEKKTELDKNGDIRFEYNLESYDEEGKEKSIKFQTTRELRDGAYLKIEYMLFRGVISWEEVQKEDIPKKLKEKF